MKKAYKLISILVIASFLSTSLTSCYGNFTLTKKLYNWNGSLGNKFVQSGVMWLLMIVPVYSVAGAVDFIILNTIQFWTGKNPMAMEAGESETQMVMMDGKEYEVIATQNRFDIRAVDTDKSISLVYDEATMSWLVNSETSDPVKIAQMNPDDLNILQLIDPEGKILSVDLTKNRLILE